MRSNEDLDDYCRPASNVARDGDRHAGQGRLGIVLVSNADDVLCGIVSVGDVRQALLRHETWDTRINEMMCATTQVAEVHRSRENLWSVLGGRLPHDKIDPLMNGDAGPLVNVGAIVEHDAEIGEFTHIAPDVVVRGDVEIGRGICAGEAAVVRQVLCLGYRTIVAAGVAVVTNFEGEGLLAGVPAVIRSKT